MRYADPSLCPDCRHDLPHGASICPSCGLLVRHPLAVDLFGVLRRADHLVGELRAASTTFHGSDSLGGAVAEDTTPPAKVAVAASGATAAPAAPTPPPVPTAPPAAPLPPYPAPRPAATGSGGGLGAASVPRILLGLGALCLLVAAVVFLAVSWNLLGVGGRTAVLAGLTLAAGGAAAGLHRIDLRIAAESLSIVALGLLALDVLGAGAAGWLGDGDGAAITFVAGAVVAAAAVASGVLRGARPALVAPQVVAGIALAVAWVGALSATDHRLLAGHAMTAAAIGVVLLGRRLDLPVLPWSAAVAAGLAWCGTAGDAFVQALLDPDLPTLWGDGVGWSLVVTAAAMTVPGVVTRHRTLLLAGASGAAVVITGVLALPCIDTDVRTVGLVAIGVTATWALALALLPRGARIVAIAPSVGGGLVLTALSLATVVQALQRWSLVPADLDDSATIRLDGPAPITEPLLLVPSLLLIVAVLALLTPDRRRALVPALHAGLISAGAGGAATLASYDVAVVWPLAVLVLTGAVAAGLALSARGSGAGADVLGVTAVALTATAALLALPSAPLTLVVGLLGGGLLLVLAVRTSPRGTTAVVAGLGLSPLVALGVVGAAYVLGGGAGWVAVPTLVLVGATALALPRIEVEVAAGVTALFALPVSLGAASDAGGLLALWLAVAGLLCCAAAALHPGRRAAGGVGAALLLLALWVRLADLGVDAPEAYTLPVAGAAIALGLWQMRRRPDLGSTTALLPGLLIATVPTLLWVLADPVSLRALLLGAACLALTILGASLRWSAPLVVGASVGAILVLRELGPYAGEVPTWVWIGLAGALLTTVGITWERRLGEVRSTLGYLGRLR